MEKISQIVGGSARVASGDAKSAPPVRPGTPTFGRSVGDSPHGGRNEMSTAQRVGIIQSDLVEQKKMRAESRIAADMETQFFFKPEEKANSEYAHQTIGSAAKGKIKIEDDVIEEPSIRATSARTESLKNGDDLEIQAPSKFTPRGSYLDVRA